MRLPILAATRNPAFGITWNQAADTIARTGAAFSRTTASFNYLRPWSLIRRCNLAPGENKPRAYWGNTGFAYDGSNGHVMVEFPKAYYKFGHTASKHDPAISFRPRSGYKIHPWFVTDGRELNFQYVGAFKGCAYDVSASAFNLTDAAGVDFTAVTGDRLCSRAGAKPMSGLNNATATLPNFRILAQNNGPGWGLESFNAISFQELLYIVKYGNWNAQSTIGIGVTNITDDGTTNMAPDTGATAGIGPAGSTDLGNADGSVTIAHYKTGQTTYPINLFGKEDFFGGAWEWKDLINIEANNKLWVADHGAQSDLFSHPYVNSGIVLPASSGYGSNLAYSEGLDYAFLPSAVAGSSSTYLCDYYYQATGNRSALFGGYWTNGAYAGPFFWALNVAAAGVGRYFGGRLAFTPQN